MRKIEHADVVAQTMAAMRLTIDRRTGDVAYVLKGKTALIDRGRAITVMSTDEAATVLALEMAVKKYRTRITAQGSEQWRQDIARIAARNNVFVEFTDPAIQLAMVEEKAMLQALLVKKDWTRETGGLPALPPAARTQAEREYQRWAAGNEKAAASVSLADYIQFRQSPRAAAYRDRADRLTRIRETILGTKGSAELRDEQEARGFIHGLYGFHGNALLDSRIKVTPVGQSRETNLNNICFLTTTARKDGRIEYRIKPADPAQAKKQTERNWPGFSAKV